MTGPPVPHDAMPTMHCAVCDTDVPAGAFCGTCGAHLSAQRGNGRGVLRPGAYAAAPGEHVLRLSVASSLFPHLPHRSRAPFRVALAVIVLTLIAFAFLRWQAPLIAVSALGLPLLFLLYLHETDIDDDLPASSLALTAALGVGLGVGWALLTGSIVADSYDVALSGGASQGYSIVEALIPAGSAVLMVLPAVVVRLWRPGTRESLDGFVIGALSAIAFVAAATLTRLAPQLATGPTAQDQPVSELLAEAGIQGVAMPLTAAAAGGLIGVALWFRRPAGMDRRPAVVLIGSSFIVVLSLYVALGLSEVSSFANGFHFGLHVLVAIVALLALRIGVQAALLHEAHDEMNPEDAGVVPALRPRRSGHRVLPELRSRYPCCIADCARRPSHHRRHRGARRTAGVRGADGFVCGGTGAAHHPHRTVDGVGCGCGSGCRGRCHGFGTGHTGCSALCVPTRLRGASDRQACRDKSMVHVQRWQILCPVPTRRYGV